jgi:hypothetical protein
MLFLLSILIVVIVLGVATIILAKIGEEVVAIVSGVIAAVSFLAFMIVAHCYISSKYKADIINREYETTYTTDEVFYASNVIDTIREINRKRIEIKATLKKEVSE